ncbi:MAG: hypothetical protein ACR2MY_12945, partial [Candidatus Dormibacteria bacterium]
TCSNNEKSGFASLRLTNFPCSIVPGAPTIGPDVVGANTALTVRTIPNTSAGAEAATVVLALGLVLLAASTLAVTTRRRIQ